MNKLESAVVGAACGHLICSTSQPGQKMAGCPDEGGALRGETEVIHYSTLYRALAASSVLTATPMQALAQESPPAREAVEDSADVIVVTARRREETLQDVPLAISAFTDKQLERQRIESLADVAAKTPGFSFESYASAALETPVLRGQSQSFLTSPVQNVATFVDGLYLQRGYMIDPGLVDMERIEVLKGPQSALYGQNAFSGAISYITKKPGNELELSVRGTIGSDERYDLSGAAGGPIIPGLLSVRVGGGFTKFGGTWKNGHPLADTDVPGPSTQGRVGGRDNWSINAAVLATPLDGLRLEASYYRNELEEEAPAQYLLLGQRAIGQLRFSDVNDLNCSPTVQFGTLGNNLWCGKLPDNPDDVPGAGTTRTAREPVIDPRSFGQSGKNEIYRGSLEYDITDDLVFLYQYGRVESRVFSARTSARDTITGLPPGAVFGVGSGRVPFDSQPNGGLFADSHEARMSYDGDGPLSVLGGAYFYDSTDYFSNRVYYVAPLGTDPIDSLRPTFPASFTILKNKTFATYGAVALETGRWEFSAEVRYNNEKIERFTTPDPVNAGAQFYNDLPDIPASPDLRPAKYEFLTPRLSVKYEPSQTSQVYASVARGAKAGGFNRLTREPQFQTYGPEFNWTYELGTKNTLLDGKLSLDAAVFYIDWSDLQITGREPTAPPTDPAIITNFAGASTWGVELSAAFRPVRGLELAGAFSHVEPKLDDGVIYLEAVVGNWCDGTVCPADGDIGGNILPRTPQTQYTLSADWQAPLTDTLDYFARVDTTYQSRQFVSFLNVGWIGSRQLVNGSIGVEGDRFSIQLWAKNLFDEKYASSSLFGGSFIYGVAFGERRTFGLTASFNY